MLHLSSFYLAFLNFTLPWSSYSILMQFGVANCYWKFGHSGCNIRFACTSLLVWRAKKCRHLPMVYIQGICGASTLFNDHWSEPRIEFNILFFGILQRFFATLDLLPRIVTVFVRTASYSEHSAAKSYVDVWLTCPRQFYLRTGSLRGVLLFIWHSYLGGWVPHFNIQYPRAILFFGTIPSLWH